MIRREIRQKDLTARARMSRKLIADSKRVSQDFPAFDFLEYSRSMDFTKTRAPSAFDSIMWNDLS